MTGMSASEIIRSGLYILTFSNPSSPLLADITSGPLNEATAQVTDEAQRKQSATLINKVNASLNAQLEIMKAKGTENMAILNGLSDKTMVDFDQNMSDIDVAWRQFYKESGNLITIIVSLDSNQSNASAGKIPYALSDPDRQQLINYVNWIFKNKFKGYNELSLQYQSGSLAKEDLMPGYPTYCALHFKKLLVSDTYEDFKKRGLLIDPYYFE